MKLQNFRWVGALGLTLFLAGCMWKETSQLDQVVWSEDGSEIAYLVLHFEEGKAGPGDGTTPKRNFRHELRLRNTKSNGSEDRVLASIRPGQNGAEFYRMKCAGYSIVPVYTADQYRVDLIRDAGGVQVIDSVGLNDRCQELHVIPSPHGEYLAKLKIKSCSSADPTQPVDYEVAILKSSDLSQTALYQLPSIQLGTFYAWTITNQFVVSDQRSAQLLDPEGSGVVQLPLPYPCMMPVTTSSYISAKALSLSIRNSEIRITPNDDDSQTFSCGMHKNMDMACRTTQDTVPSVEPSPSPSVSPSPSPSSSSI